MHLRHVLLTLPLIGLATPSLAATTYDGITFPGGDASFADRVVDSRVGENVVSPYDDPTEALGPPDWDPVAETGFYSLGLPVDPSLPLGFVTVEFTDNVLTTSGDADPDLFVFEIGAALEQFLVEISRDDVTYISAGTLTGQPTQIDIDALPGVSVGDTFRFVRVTDALGGPPSGSPFGGPDIDAIGAISSAPPPPIPLPAAGWGLLAALGALAALRRRR